MRDRGKEGEGCSCRDSVTLARAWGTSLQGELGRFGSMLHGFRAEMQVEFSMGSWIGRLESRGES